MRTLSVSLFILFAACEPGWSLNNNDKAPIAIAEGGIDAAASTGVEGGVGTGKDSSASTTGGGGDANSTTGADSSATGLDAGDGSTPECTTNPECPATDPKCAERVCSSCTGPEDCTVRIATPACDSVSGDCVECTASDDAKCTADSKVCLTGGTSCVPCNTDTDCALPGKAKCDMDSHECVPCDDSKQCAHVTVGVDDNLDVCNAGTCVACTPATEPAECGSKACDPDTLTCTGKDRNSVATCGTCRSDSECLTTNHKCVQVPFMGVSSGYHCMLQVPGGGCTLPPYQAAPLTATSKNGAASTQYCSHNTNVTTCEAILSLTSARACTAETAETLCGQGGRCEAVNTAPNKCTYACSSDLECPGVTPCNEQSSGSPYCGGSGL